MRLDKLLSNLKYGTRSEIKRFIKSGYASVNGEICKNPGVIVNELIDTIIFDDQLVEYKRNILLMMNKPSGYISSSEVGLHKNVFELLDEPYNRLDLKIAGRLDIDTEGLLLLTDNGKLVHEIISPNKLVYKRYYVKTGKSIDISLFDKKMEIKDGKDMLFTPMKPITEYISDNEFYLSIAEGKFHQVKRMVEYLGSNVIYLKRVSIGEIHLDESLELGEYKEIEPII